MTLNELAIGRKARILSIRGRDRFRNRMLELGISSGVLIEKVKYAPMRDPVELIVKNSHLSLRCKDAGKISVELVE